jgi:hypothetical protein
MTGWIAVGEIGQAAFLNDYLKWQDEVIDQAVNNVGINRIQLGAGAVERDVDHFAQVLAGTMTNDEFRNFFDYAVNDNNDPNVINPSGFKFSRLDFQVDSLILPFKQAVEANGEQAYIVATYGHNNRTERGYTGWIPHYDSNDPNNDNLAAQEYAENMLAVFQHLDQKYGFVPDGVEVANEPNGTKEWSATKIGLALVATANRLANHGYYPDFIAPSRVNVGSSVSWFDTMVTNVPASLNDLTEISYHCYGGCGTDANLINIASRAIQYNILSSQTEKIGHNYINLHRDLKLARASAWEQFALAFPGAPPNDNGGAYFPIDITDPMNPIVLIGSRTKYLRQYFKFIRIGATRVSATLPGCDDDAMCTGTFDPLAFINTSGKYVVIVKATAADTFSIQGLPAGTYGIKYTTNTGSGYDVDLPDQTISVGQVLTSTIPSQGVITIYQKTGGVPLPTSTPTSTPTPTPIPIPGDANGDDMVDGIDYVIWLNQYLKPPQPDPSGDADFNQSGTVDGVDYVIWLNNYQP